MKEPRADAKLKTLPEESQAAIFALFTATPDREPMTLEDACGWVYAQKGISVSLDTLSRWRSWYALRARMDAAKAKAEQARLEMLTQNPDMSPERLEEVAQMVFTAETLEGGDIKNYVALATLRLNQRRTEMDERKLKLLEAKAAQADAAKALSASDMTADQKADRLKEIFRMG